MKTKMRYLVNSAFVFIGNLTCSCSYTGHADSYPTPCREDKSPVISPHVSKILVRSLGFRVDQEVFYSTIRLGRCDYRNQCEWLLEQVNKSEFKQRFVPNLNPPYYLLFLTARDKIVCALECYDDNFQFVQAKKTFWTYYVGQTIPVPGSKWKPGDPYEWGEIPDFKEAVWKMCERDPIITHP